MSEIEQKIKEKKLFPLENKGFSEIVAFKLSGSKLDIFPEEEPSLIKEPNKIKDFPNCKDIILEKDVALHSLVIEGSSVLEYASEGKIDKNSYFAGANIMYEILLNEASKKNILLPLYKIDEKPHSNNLLIPSKNKHKVDYSLHFKIEEIISKPEYKSLALSLKEELKRFAFELPEIYKIFYTKSKNDNNTNDKNNLNINSALIFGASKIYNVFRNQI